MASLIQELIGILDKECTIYEQLIPVSLEKTQIIVKNDTAALSVITEKEQSAVEQINSLEHKREEVITNIKTVLSIKADSLNLDTLIGLLGRQEKEQRALSILHDKLKSTLQKLSDLNNHNKALIQQSLEMIEFNMNFIQSTRMSPGNNTYTKSASCYDAQAFETGMFDAKQ